MQWALMRASAFRDLKLSLHQGKFLGTVRLEPPAWPLCAFGFHDEGRYPQLRPWLLAIWPVPEEDRNESFGEVVEVDLVWVPLLSYVALL